MEGREKEGLLALGKKTEYRQDYAPEVLESFINKHPDNDYWVQFNCPEFTSLCPITGQPDFAEIKISYMPDKRMVESKSLKLYLFSFRNHGDFHEDCVNKIMKDLIKLMDPKYIEVTGIFTPRGGISIYPYANYGRPGTKYEKRRSFVSKIMLCRGRKSGGWETKPPFGFFNIARFAAFLYICAPKFKFGVTKYS